jgi:hypothetical protein
MDFSNNIVKSTKFKIKNMLHNNVKPTIQTSTYKNTDHFVKYPCISNNYKYSSVDFKDEYKVGDCVEVIFQDLIDCIYDYPERYIHLIGYPLDYLDSNAYIIDMYTVYTPDSEW